MQKSLVIFSALLLAACMTADGNGPKGLETNTQGGECSADDTAAFVGRQATQELGGEVLQATNARVLRWIPPNSAVTMDYRIDRVSVSYDEEKVVTQVTCG